MCEYEKYSDTTSLMLEFKWQHEYPVMWQMVHLQLLPSSCVARISSVADGHMMLTPFLVIYMQSGAAANDANFASAPKLPK